MTAKDATSEEAADPKAGMTVAELEGLLQRARNNKATGGEVIEVTTVGWTKQRIKTATIPITPSKVSK